MKGERWQQVTVFGIWWWWWIHTWLNINNEVETFSGGPSWISCGGSLQYCTAGGPFQHVTVSFNIPFRLFPFSFSSTNLRPINQYHEPWYNFPLWTCTVKFRGNGGVVSNKKQQPLPTIHYQQFFFINPQNLNICTTQQNSNLFSSI